MPVQTTDVYNTNSIPHSIPGGVVTVLSSVAASLGDFVFENFSTNRPQVIIKRPNQVAGDGGWVAAGVNHRDGQVTLQINLTDALPAGNWPASGSYFIINAGFGNEKWVLLDIGQPFQSGDYWKATYSVMMDASYVG